MRALFWNDSGKWWLNFSEVKFDILICWLCTAAALTIYVSCPLILYANTTLNMAMRWIKCVVNENTQLQCGKLNYCEKPFIYTDLLLSEIYLFPWLYWCIFFCCRKTFGLLSLSRILLINCVFLIKSASWKHRLIIGNAKSAGYQLWADPLWTIEPNIW